MTLNWRHKAGLFLTVVTVGIGLFLECSAKQAVGIALLGVAFSWLIGSLPARALVATFAILLCAVGLYVATAPVLSDRNSAQKSAAEYDLAIADLQSEVKSAKLDIESGLVPNGGSVPIPPGATIGAPQKRAKPKKQGQYTVDDTEPPRPIDSADATHGTDQPIKVFSDPYAAYGGGIINESKTDSVVTIPDSAQSWIRPDKKPQGDWFTQNASLRVSFPKTMPDAGVMQVLRGNLLLPRPTVSLGSSVHAHAWRMFGGLVLFISGLSILCWLFLRARARKNPRGTPYRELPAPRPE